MLGWLILIAANKLPDNILRDNVLHRKIELQTRRLPDDITFRDLTDSLSTRQYTCKSSAHTADSLVPTGH